MADIDYEKLSDSIARALKRSGGFSGGGTSGGTGGGGTAVGGAALENLKEGLKDGGTAFIDAAKASAGTFRQLSNSGANFSNDIIGMNVAAAQSRLSLDEFSNVIANNGKNMAGLGGSVTRGAEAFAKMSKGFFDSNAGDELQQMGYSAKELNEVLALQASTQRYTMGESTKDQAKARESASALAKEMDAIAKLTGKSKEEQMEAAKKRASDGQVEAKLRLIGIEQGADAEKAARAAFQKQFAEAEARGMGQMAKEMFATGTVTSEEAATQYALLGEAAQKTGEQMGHLAKGNIAAAEAASKEADAANAKNQRDPTLLRMAAMGDAAGSVGTILKKSTEDNMALHDSVMGLVKGNSNLLKSQDDYAKALATIRTDIIASQEGRLKPGGERVSGATQGVVATQIAGQNLGAGVAGAIENAKDKEGRSIAGAGRRTGEELEATLKRFAGPGENAATKIERAAIRGQNPPAAAPPSGNKVVDEANRTKTEGSTAEQAIGSLVKSISIAGNTTVDIAKATLNVGKGTPIATNADGGYIATPTLSTLAEEGPEFVLNQGQMRDTIAAAGMSGVRNILGKLPPPGDDKPTAAPPDVKITLPTPNKLAPPSEKPDMSFAESMTASIRKGMQTVGAGNLNKEPSIDMAAISKDISTTISSVQGGGSTTTKRTQTDESKSAQEEMSKLTDTFYKDVAARKDILIEGMAVEDRKYSKVQAAMKADEIAVKMKEEYEKKKEEIQKKIDDGIKWEVESQQMALEDTKKLIAEELAITLQGKEARLSELENEEALKLIGLEQGSEAEAEARLKYQAEAAAAVEKHSQKIAMDIKGALPITDFSDQAEEQLAKQAALDSSATVSLETSKSTPATPAIDLNAVNLPGFGPQMKANAASVPAAVNAPTDSDTAREDAKNKRKAEEAKAAAAATPAATPAAKTAALDDVVKGLDMLNITMNKLLSQSDELGRKQISAMEKNPKNMYS